MNKVILSGHLTRDPELKTTSSGTNVCHFQIGVKRKFASGEAERETDFFSIVVWRNLGSLCAKYLKKGSKCSVLGRIQNRTYEDDKNIKHYVTEVIADEVEFLSFLNDEPKETNTIEEPVGEPTPVEDGNLPF